MSVNKQAIVERIARERLSDKQAVIGKAISETDWLWAKPFISVQTQYELTKNILTATDYFDMLAERDELKATVNQYGDNIMELCKAIHQHVQRERVMAKVVEAAREALKTALRQWEMYANEMRFDTFIEDSGDVDDIEAILYQKCKQVLTELDALDDIILY